MPAASPAAELVFTTLLTEGPLSRVAVSARTGLSSAAVTKAVRPLLGTGFLIELTGGGTGERIGRPAVPLQVNAERARFAGVKLTVDEAVGVVVDLQARVRATHHLPLPSADAGQAVDAIGELLGELLDGSPEIRGLGVAVSGDIDRRAGVVRYSPFLDWHSVPLARLVEARTGLATVLENDVRALTVAEQWFGAGVGAGNFAVVTVGTGIGCGLVANGRVVSGAYGVAGEIGHLPIDARGPLCHCGNRGCVEAIASEHAITEAAAAATGIDGLTPARVVELARDGDHPAVRAVFARAGHAIGLALASVANLVGPERIVISGEGLAAYDLFADQMRTTFAAQTFGAAARCELIVRPLPFEQWARGAAAVAISDFIRPGRY
jgi:predicted NBD/HSP70 family sugar kinase/biotin operon repressor